MFADVPSVSGEIESRQRLVAGTKWRRLSMAAIVALIVPHFSAGTDAADGHGKSAAGAINSSAGADLQTFWKLYRERNYTAAAELFEEIMRSGKPDANAYYYAALTNQQINRQVRANQLLAYVVSAFPGTVQAQYAQKQIASSTRPVDAKGPAEAELPASVKNQLSPEQQALLGTAVGKQAVAQALKEQAANIEVIKQAEKQGVLKSSNVSLASASVTGAASGGAAASGAGQAPAEARRKGDHPFTPQDIAREGPNGIDQTNAENCWFESAMSALAQLPRGQRLIAQMITYGDGDSYVVRFPGDGVEYKITPADLRASGVNCKALWASLLDYAERQKFPFNSGSNGPDADKHRLQVGLSSITGCNAEMIFPSQSSKQDLSSFIYGAVSSQNPITAGTAGRNTAVHAPIIESHAYAIIGFDAARGMVTIRNPHGRRSRRFSLADDPMHLRFEQLDDGVFKMNLDLFCDSFGSVCRSFI